MPSNFLFMFAPIATLGEQEMTLSEKQFWTNRTIQYCLVEVSSWSNTRSLRDYLYWTSGKKSVKLIELSSINKVSFCTRIAMRIICFLSCSMWNNTSVQCKPFKGGKVIRGKYHILNSITADLLFAKEHEKQLNII